MIISFNEGDMQEEVVDAASRIVDSIGEQEPELIDAMFIYLSTFPVNDKDGMPSTLIRELVKDWGLDPDRLTEHLLADSEI